MITAFANITLQDSDRVARAFLAAISPYQNLKPGVHYPQALIWTTTKDDRVGPQHARKFAARLAALGVPYLFYEETEGGHAAFAPSDEVEDQIWSQFRARHGRVSIERILSGRGLFELYGVLARMRQVEPVLTDEKSVYEAATKGDELAGETLDRFCGILGSVAGDLALSFGARGGVFISGGIAPRMADRLASGAFRARFEDKGRLTDYLKEVPTSLVLHPYPALIGAARELAMMERL